MTIPSFPLEEEVILKVADFTEEGLVSPGEKSIVKINLSMQGNEHER